MRGKKLSPLLVSLLPFRCLLTSCTGFKQQCVSEEEVRVFGPWNRFHQKPFVQIPAQHLVGDVGKHSNEDANSKKKETVIAHYNGHVFPFFYGSSPQMWTAVICLHS